MIRTVIIEDEFLAREGLRKMLSEIPDIQIIAEIESVSQAVLWFTQNPKPDLVFLDIHIADGVSFSIFERVDIQCSIIFVTAYDEYALRAFELQSIDYLLKPVHIDSLKAAVEKFKRMTGNNSYAYLQQLVTPSESKLYKERFVVHIGTKIYTFTVQDISCFYVFEKGTYLFTKEAKSYPIDYSLDAIENSINPKDFFRVNRQYLVSYRSISSISKMSSSAIKICLKPAIDASIMVSTHKTVAFKKWLQQ